MTRRYRQTYLKAYRRKAALSQSELGELLGISSHAVGKYEAGKRLVPATVLIASEIIFGTSAASIFPALYNSVEEDLAIRALGLYDRLASSTDPLSAKKLKIISGIPGRLR